VHSFKCHPYFLLLIIAVPLFYQVLCEDKIFTLFLQHHKDGKSLIHTRCITETAWLFKAACQKINLLPTPFLFVLKMFAQQYWLYFRYCGTVALFFGNAFQLIVL